MATIKNPNTNIFNMSPNIVIAVDDSNMGEMYVYDNKFRYILNGLTASDLICYFAEKGDMHLSNEIMETVMIMTAESGTN